MTYNVLSGTLSLYTTTTTTAKWQQYDAQWHHIRINISAHLSVASHYIYRGWITLSYQNISLFIVISRYMKLYNGTGMPSAIHRRLSIGEEGDGIQPVKIAPQASILWCRPPAKLLQNRQGSSWQAFCATPHYTDPETGTRLSRHQHVTVYNHQVSKTDESVGLLRSFRAQWGIKFKDFRGPTSIGGFQATKLSMKSHILHWVRQNLDCMQCDTVTEVCSHTVLNNA